MRIRCGYQIAYECPRPTPMILLLKVHPSRDDDLETPDLMITDPAIPARDYADRFGNICTRLLAPPGRLVLRSDFVVRDTGEPDPIVEDAPQVPVEDLPDEVMVFLLSSRYCETELLSDFAWKTFGSTPPGWGRVQAIVDYAHERIQFGYQHARPTMTAFEAHQEQRGVCRDFAHLAVTLCRCMNIPARYCTGYLGDIGVPYSPAPMDFSAWFQVWLGDRWHTFDARHNTPRIGRVLMAVGRDATDTAIITNFGAARLEEFTVITDELVA